MTELKIEELEQEQGGIFPAIVAGYFVGQAAAELFNKLNNR